MNSIIVNATATIKSSREFKAVFTGTLYDLLTQIAQMTGGFKTEDNRRLNTMGELEEWFDKNANESGQYRLYPMNYGMAPIDFTIEQ